MSVAVASRDSRTSEGVVSAIAPKRFNCRMRGSLFRYQARTNLYRGENFYKMFVDGAWKWKGQQRFAGGGVNPYPKEGEPAEYKLNTGHYFATTSDSARAEIRHYIEEDFVANYALLEIDVTIDDILDLTELNSIRAVANAYGVKGNIWDLLAELISTETGGNALSTASGHYAHNEGYAGVRFFSARALTPRQAERLREARYWDDVAEYLEKKPVLESMQRQSGGQCIVVFSGTLLTRAVKSYRIDDGPWEENPRFGCDQSTIEELWGEFGPDYQYTQAMQNRATYILTAEGTKSPRRSS
jgi:hypothetical protein